ncbi:hypothetical protein [Nocardia sp. NPDC056000]|uniref:hypothetical protein n=1 Tax=Nocardia sp. NPDC056000 TaxID=3345674 RepID=UPI0035D91018
MAEWISVYCREPILLDGDEIRRWIETADLWTWAETLYDDDELAEAAAESVLANLRVHAGTAVDVYWTESGRPLQISFSPAAAEEVSEAVSQVLGAADGPGPVLIRDHLAAVRHVINIEMAAADSMSMGAVLGEIVALELAAASDGLVWFFGKDWVSPQDRAGTLWTRS